LRVKSPYGEGLTGGLLMVNGQARDFHKDPHQPTRGRNAMQDETVNVTPYLRFGQTNRIELWPLAARNGTMDEESIVIHELAIGCAVE